MIKKSSCFSHFWLVWCLETIFLQTTYIELSSKKTLGRFGLVHVWLKKTLETKLRSIFSTHVTNFKKFRLCAQRSDRHEIFFRRKFYVCSFKENCLQASGCQPKFLKTACYFFVIIFPGDPVRTYIESEMCKVNSGPPSLKGKPAFGRGQFSEFDLKKITN